MSLKDYKSIGIIYSNNYGQIEKVIKRENGSIFLMKKVNKKFLRYKDENKTLSEIEKLASISHQNLSEYLHYFFEDNFLYLIMEYEDESELKEKLKYNVENHLSFEENYLWSLFIQLLNLLKFIEDNKGIEFNFTRFNILLMNNGLLKIFDYGQNYLNLSFKEYSWMQDSLILPPEIIDKTGTIFSESVNIWKVGCIIYELCTLNPPFKLNNFKEKFKLIGSKYSNDFNILISKMLVVDNKHRATIEELLNNEIIKNKNIEIEDNKINEEIFTLKKINLRETKRQRESQNEMMQNDKYEIMKFTLSQKNELNNDDLISTAQFNIENNNQNDNNEPMIDDFKERVMKALMNKRIIDNNNNDFNYNNPYRNNNNNINENVRAKKKVIQKFNQSKKANNAINNFNKKNEIKNKFNNKNIIKENDVLNFIKKERQKTPIHSNLKNNFFIDKNDKGNLNKNKKIKEDKKFKLIYPNSGNNYNCIDNINIIKSDNEIKPKFSINKRDLKEKTEQIMNMLNTNKRGTKRILKEENERYKPKNMSNKIKHYPMIEELLKNHTKKSDNKVNKIIENKNANKNKDIININYGNIKSNEKIINNNKNLLKKFPIIHPVNNLPKIVYGKNKKIKIEYGEIKYKTKKK